MDAETLLKESEDIIEKRKEKITNKIRNWLSNKYNLVLVGILAFAIIIRLFYFFITKSQAVWWDAAEYMNMARAWAFGLEYEFLPVRPILFSLIIALFYKIGNPEFLARLFIFALSITSIIGAYLLGKEVYNRKVGLITAFLMSVFYLHLFHSFRLLVDLPSLTFFTFAAFFFYKYFKTNSHKALYWGAVIIAIGTLFRITTATFLFAITIYVLITEKLSFIKKKEYWIAAFIFIIILSPYIIWGYLQFHGFVITKAGAWNAPQGNYISNGLSNFKSYLALICPYIFTRNNNPSIISWPLLIFFILGLISMYKLFLGFDVLIKGNNFKLKRDLFLLLIFIIPIIFISFSMGGGYFEDRYILNAFPAIFIISGAFILKTYDFIKQKRKFLAILFLIILLCLIAYIQLQHADDLIKNKKDSYAEIKQAGLWLKQNSDVSDIVATKSWPQIKYYSERDIIGIPETKEKFDSLLANNSNIRFYVVSVFETHQNWMYSYPQEKGLTPVQIYFLGNTDQPAVIIYNF